MRGRQVGLARLQGEERRQAILQRDFRQAGDSLQKQELRDLQRQMETFETNLKEFAQKHRKDIRRDPIFRTQFQRMCANIGVDPLASNKGFWAGLLGVGDFYYELGIQVIEGCLESRSRDGGLTELGELKKRLERSRSVQQEITEDDIIYAIRTLKPLSGGFEVLTLGKSKMVRSVPKELDRDETELLRLAEEKGYIDHAAIDRRLGWTTVRADAALHHLLEDGIGWLDAQGEHDTYWIPGYCHLDQVP